MGAILRLTRMGLFLRRLKPTIRRMDAEKTIRDSERVLLSQLDSAGDLEHNQRA